MQKIKKILGLGFFFVQQWISASVVTVINATKKPIQCSAGGGRHYDKPITVKPEQLKIVTINKALEKVFLNGVSYVVQDINWKRLTCNSNGTFTVTNPLYEFVVVLENRSTSHALTLYEQKNNDRIAKWTIEKGLTQAIKVVGGVESTYYLEVVESQASTKKNKVQRSNAFTMFALQHKRWIFYQNKFLKLQDLMINAMVTIQNDSNSIIHFRKQRTFHNIATIKPTTSQKVSFSGLSSYLFNLNPEDSNNPGYGDMPSEAFRPAILDGGTFIANADGTFTFKPKVVGV